MIQRLQGKTAAPPAASSSTLLQQSPTKAKGTGSQLMASPAKPAASPTKTQDKEDVESVAAKSLTLSQQLRKTSAFRHRTEQDIMQSSLQDVLKDHAHLKPFKQPMECLLDRESMEAMQPEVLPIDEIKEFHAYHARLRALGGHSCPAVVPYMGVSLN